MHDAAQDRSTVGPTNLDTMGQLRHKVEEHNDLLHMTREQRPRNFASESLSVGK